MCRALLAALFLVPVPLAAEIPGNTQLPAIVVRAYGRLMPVPEMLDAHEQAGRILRQAGISVSWLECWSEAAAAKGACQRPRGENEFILRMVRAIDGNASAHRESLGFSLIDVGAGTGVVATVYSDRVTAVAAGAQISPIDLMARAIAHEIGHLLLGTTAHAQYGLMRARWTRNELHRNFPPDWLFSMDDASKMRLAVLSTASPASGIVAMR